LIYFPIILNITVLSLAVRFDGSLFTGLATKNWTLS